MARAGMAGRVKVRTANMKMFDAEVRTLVGIFNDAWSDNWGFVPFTQAEIDHASKAFGPVIVPELAVFVEVDDEAVAFIVALTNLNEAIVDFNGRLGPINLAKLLWRLKIAGVGSTRVPLMGVKKKFRNHPLMGAGLAMMAIDQLRAERQAAGQDQRRAGLDPRGQQGDQQHHPLGRRRALQDPSDLREGPGLTRRVTPRSPPPRPHSAFAPFANRAFPAAVDGQPAVQRRRLDADHGGGLGDDQPDAEPIFVALLAAAGTLPMFLFCFFAGILADRFDRRRYIIVCQVWMMGVAATLAVLAFFGQLNHWNLLALAFCMGLGNAMNAPAWHAVVPEIVSGPLLRPAIALNSAGFNLARTVGPVLGQILLGLVGVFLLFAINACTYIGVIFAMASWRRSAEARAGQRREGFVEAARTGIAFVRGSGELKAVFARGLCFFVPGIAISTLLPVIGRFELGLDEFSFGVLYAVFGVGAVAAAILMPTLNRLLGPDRANIWAMGLQAPSTLVAALAMTPYVVGACIALSGACWITVIANNGTAVQMILPNFMRARGMAVHQMVFFGAMVVGSLLWGKIATLFGTQASLIVSALALVPLHGARRLDPAAGLVAASRLTRLCVLLNTRPPEICSTGKNPLVTASISCRYAIQDAHARAAGP